ncbi:substrate-binding domain-containing protein [[Clostridium] fimetarium]|uniref:Tungstate transport system substrate-binding protein n=1 Tax=[Clostridium] fimetarium TaxID=99656 RepID=A0A1I0RF46_9FIRM|nr:substrate-binding domain-containing protein [[Clostridium] fimetarium]SEW39467.1 tungstate transport system substrate-binding protein [[Clostridium] fimetarium]
MKKKASIILLCMMMAAIFCACGNTKVEEKVTTKATVAIKGKIILSTTTSTQDSGLLDVLIPKFTEQTGWQVDTIAVGTGEALKMGENGEADVLLVHAKEKEDAFILAGFGVKRYDVMYNDFVVIGPAGAIAKNESIKTTFQTIYDKQYTFISRGDQSGTNTKEISIWKNLSITPANNPNYISSGQGMGATILMSDEKKAYTLTDRATWLTTKDKTSMQIICENDSQLMNYYGVIAVNPQKNPKVNVAGGQAFVDWILSDETQKFIGSFGVEKYGQVLFTPNASANK